MQDIVDPTAVKEQCKYCFVAKVGRATARIGVARIEGYPEREDEYPYACTGKTEWYERGFYGLVVTFPHDLSDGEGSFGQYADYSVAIQWKFAALKLELVTGKSWEHVD